MTLDRAAMAMDREASAAVERDKADIASIMNETPSGDTWHPAMPAGFGHAIRTFMVNKRVTIDQLAKRMGVAWGTADGYAAGRIPTKTNPAKFASVLGLTVATVNRLLLTSWANEYSPVLRFAPARTKFLADALFHAIYDRGWSFEQAGEATGIRHDHLRNYIARRSRANRGAMIRLEAVFGRLPPKQRAIGAADYMPSLTIRLKRRMSFNGAASRGIGNVVPKRVEVIVEKPVQLSVPFTPPAATSAHPMTDRIHELVAAGALGSVMFTSAGLTICRQGHNPLVVRGENQEDAASKAVAVLVTEARMQRERANRILGNA